MLHQVITASSVLPPLNHASSARRHCAAMHLVAGLRRSLDADPALAHHYLDRLSDLLGPETLSAATDRDLLPAWAPRPLATKGSLAPWQERRVCDFIEAHLETPILARDLAELIQLSTGHFSRAFKASTGETPHAYIVRQRIRRAQILMLETREPLSQIACACGFTDQAHLARLFRAVLDATPAAWRRKWQRPLHQ